MLKLDRRIAVVAVATFFAGLPVIGDEPSTDAPLIAKIEWLGGKAECDDALPGRPVTAVRFGFGSRLDDRFVLMLKRLRSLTRLDLDRTSITDARVLRVAELSGMKRLSLSRTLITDGALEHI